MKMSDNFNYRIKITASDLTRYDNWAPFGSNHTEYSKLQYEQLKYTNNKELQQH
jgi:hypothetical protein